MFLDSFFSSGFIFKCNKSYITPRSEKNITKNEKKLFLLNKKKGSALIMIPKLNLGFGS